MITIGYYVDKKISKDMDADRKMYPATCADCKKETQVPFQPKEGRPVYCRECLPKHRGERRF
jgi:CxxC-x17-CxxC domain-containing protein